MSSKPKVLGMLWALNGFLIFGLWKFVFTKTNLSFLCIAFKDQSLWKAFSSFQNCPVCPLFFFWLVWVGGCKCDRARSCCCCVCCRTRQNGAGIITKNKSAWTGSEPVVNYYVKNAKQLTASWLKCITKLTCFTQIVLWKSRNSVEVRQYCCSEMSLQQLTADRYPGPETTPGTCPNWQSSAIKLHWSFINNLFIYRHFYYF